MTDIQHKMRKGNRQFLFEVDLNWLSENKGILSANDAAGAIQVATPAAFGGKGKEWSPEHLFLGSVSSCFMTTYLLFARKSELEVSRFECNIIGQIELTDGKYQFTHINIFPKIYVADEALKEKAKLVLQKTQQYCLVANSIKAKMIYHAEVLKDSPPRLSPMDDTNYKDYAEQ